MCLAFLFFLFPVNTIRNIRRRPIDSRPSRFPWEFQRYRLLISAHSLTTTDVHFHVFLDFNLRSPYISQSGANRDGLKSDA